MRAWAFAAVALLFTAAGCGGDDTSDPGRGGSGGIIGVGGSGGGTGGDGGTGGVGGSGGTGGSGGSGGVPGPVCGDGVIEGDEECDGTNLAGKSCVDFEGFLGGTLGCTDCRFDFSDCHGVEVCSNGLDDDGDGAVDCDDADCFDDVVACPRCGDGVINGDDQCEGEDLGGATCETLGYNSGTLGCTEGCRFDDSGCTLVEFCDNGLDDDGDGDADCDDADCFDDVVACPRCGDGIINGDDQCEGEDLGGATCETLGYNTGTLACGADCSFDETGCALVEFCGNGIDDDGDGDADCDDSDCFDDVVACPRCGDGIINQDEEVCDGTAIVDTCADHGFSGGTIACDAGCDLDLSGCLPFEDCATPGDEDQNGDADCDDAACLGHFECPVCNDGILQRDEECENDTVPAGASCADYGFNSGSLACAGCQIDTSGCTLIEICDNGIDDDANGDTDCDDATCAGNPPCPVCGNNVVEEGEACDMGPNGPGNGCDANCQIEYLLVPGTANGTVARSGSIDASDPTFNRAIATCGSLSAYSPYYDVHYLLNDTPQIATVSIHASWAGDGFLLAYRLPFDPANPLQNCAAGNDDLEDEFESRIDSLELAPGEAVAIVTTTFYANDAIGPYTLTVTTLALCGNGEIERDEACDDGNTDPLDGCDATCQVEPGWTCNGSVCSQTVCGDGIIEGTEECEFTGGTPPAGCDGTTCRLTADTCADAYAIGPVHLDPSTAIWTVHGDTTPHGQDYSHTTSNCGVTGHNPDVVFAFTAPNAGTYRIEVVDNAFDDMFFVWDGACGQGSPEIACKDTGAQDVELTAGQQIFIVVTGYGTAPDDFGPFTLTIEGFACGNGVLQAGETCDLGDTTPGDGCDANCQLEPNYACDETSCWLTTCGDGVVEGREECEPGQGNPACTADCLLPGESCFLPIVLDASTIDPGTGRWTWTGDTTDFADSFTPACSTSVAQKDVFFAFTAPLAGDYEVVLNSTGFDGILTIEDGTCGAPRSLLYCGDSTERDTVTLAAGQSIVVIVDSYSTSPSLDDGPFTLTIESRVCGDGDIDPGETCDLGDLLPDDGCDPNCQLYPGWACDENGCWQIVCGNSIVEPGEQCDDGGTTPGDGCDAACLLEGDTCADAYPLGAAHKDPNAWRWTLDADTSLMNPDYSVSSCGAAGAEKDMVIRFTAPIAGNYRFDVVDQSWDDMLWVWDSPCGQGATELACVDTGSDTAQLAANQEVFIVVAGYGSSSANGDHGPFRLVVEAMVCGDGVVQVDNGETCDDGGTVDGDGCSATCIVEWTPEVEPNDSIATANPLGYGASGSIMPGTESDYFSVTLTAGTTYTFQTAAAPDGFCDSIDPHDTEMRIMDANDTELAFSQDEGPGYCSLLTFTPQTTDTYYVKVTSYYWDTPDIPQYYLFWWES